VDGGLPQQARLADTGLPRDKEDRRPLARQMPPHQGKLAGAPHEWDEGRGGHVDSGAPRPPGGRRRRGQEGCALLWLQPQRHGQPLHRLAMGAPFPALQVHQPTHAHLRPLGQLLLRQASRQPIALERLAEYGVLGRRHRVSASFSGVSLALS